MNKYLLYGTLIGVPALCTLLLNMYRSVIPFAAEGTLLVMAVSTVSIAYFVTTPYYRALHVTQPISAVIFAGLCTSIVVFVAAQLIRLLGGLLYAATFLNDSNALAYQMHYVLPNFLGGITQSFTSVVGISFVLGICLALPLIIMLNRTRTS